MVIDRPVIGWPRPIHDYHDDAKYPKEGAFWQWEFLRREASFQILSHAANDYEDGDDWEQERRAWARAESFSTEDGQYPTWAGRLVHLSGRDVTESAYRFECWHFLEDHGPADAPTVADRDRRWTLDFPWHVAGPKVTLPFMIDVGSAHKLGVLRASKDHIASYFSGFARTLLAARRRIPQVDRRLLLLAFDAGAPLEPQVRRLRRLHRDARAELVSATQSGEIPAESVATIPRARDLHEVIRVLDARAAGLTHEKVAEALEISVDHAQEQARRGTSLVSGGYRWLALPGG